jgi:hypothetical protein
VYDFNNWCDASKTCIILKQGDRLYETHGYFDRFTTTTSALDSIKENDKIIVEKHFNSVIHVKSGTKFGIDNEPRLISKKM